MLHFHSYPCILHRRADTTAHSQREKKEKKERHERKKKEREEIKKREIYITEREDREAQKNATFG